MVFRVPLSFFHLFPLWKNVRVYGNLILLQVSAEDVYLYDSWDSRELAFYYPVLYGAELHGIVFVSVFLVDWTYFLIIVGFMKAKL